MEKKLSFEEGLQALEDTATALESGEMTLEESFVAYERAMALKKELEKILDSGDARIRVLTESGEHELDAGEEA